MKLRGINRNLLIIFSLILAFGIIFGIMNTITDPVKSRQDVDLPKSSYADEVNYGEWVGIYWSYPDSNDYIDWSFNGSNSYVGITVIAMDDTNFWNFDNGYSYTCYNLSSGAYYIDSGTFYPPYEDQWYIIFMNEDPDMQSTYLTYEGTWYAVPDTLTITSPTSSSSWERGTNKYIYWNTQGSVDYVDLRWYKGGVLKYYYYDLTNDGDSYWAIPSDCEIGTDWRIYIEDSSDSSVNDYSDYFEIYGKSITITSPTSSSSWERGTAQHIYWTTTGTINYVDIDVYKGGVLKYYVDDEPNDGDFYWAIPSDCEIGTDWRIYIEDSSDSSVNDYSDYFEIYGETLTITSPTSSSSWEKGTSQYIYWDTTGTVNYVDLYWYKGGVLKYYYYDLTNDGDFYWAIPSDCEIGTDWRIYIEDSSDSSVNDYSDYFEIYSSGSITVTSPTSSSSCQCGTSHTIRWSTTGSISSVKIELYKGAAFEKSIIVSTTNDGEYGWSIPTDLYDSSNYRIKITDATDSSVYDYSDYFQITIPSAAGTPEDEGIPGYDIFIIIGIVSIISLIINKKRNKN